MVVMVMMMDVGKVTQVFSVTTIISSSGSSQASWWLCMVARLHCFCLLQHNLIHHKKWSDVVMVVVVDGGRIKHMFSVTS